MTSILWGALSWALTPALQSYLIQTDPKTSDIQQSLNTSALQIGISIGSGIGGLAFSMSGSVTHLASFGSILVLVALGYAILSIRKPTIS